MIRTGLTALVLILTLATSLLQVAPVDAQAATITIQSVNTHHDFPNSVTYSAVASASSDIVVAELYWHAANDPALTLVEVEFEPSLTISVEHSVDMLTNYLPPGTEISYYWRFEDQSGNVASSLEQQFQYSDLRFDWMQASSGPITVWWYRGNEDFGNEILETAGVSLSDLNQRFDVTLTSPVQIVVYGSDRDFSSAMPPNSADWIGGVAYANLDIIVAQIAPGSGSSSEINRLISHEMSHLAVHQTTENSYNAPPNWLDEGLATYNQATVDNRLVRALDDAVSDGRLIPVQALNSSFPLDDRQALLSYAESWSLIEYLVEVYGDQSIADLLSVFKLGVSYEDAVETVLDLTYEELDAQWKIWLGYSGDDPAAIEKEDTGDGGFDVPAGVLIAGSVMVTLVCMVVIVGVLLAAAVFLRRSTATN